MSKEIEGLQGSEICSSEIESNLSIKIIHHTFFTDKENAEKGILSDSDELSECRRIRVFGEQIIDPSIPTKERNRFMPYTRSENEFSDKFTIGAVRCLVSIFLGTSKLNPSQPISEIYHIQPGFFGPGLRGNDYRMDYQVKMMVLKNSIAHPDSVLAVVAGGSLQKHQISDLDEEAMPHNASRWLEETHYKHLGTPTIILPPKEHVGATSIYVNTRDSEVHVVNHFIEPEFDEMIFPESKR